MTTYSIDDGNSNQLTSGQLTSGLQEHEARQTAQRMADQRDESVYLYADSEGSEQVKVNPRG